MKIQKVSLEQIAKLAGVHKATVSRALRNHPSIPLATRERIKEIAEGQGYRPNPIVSMFQAQARSSRPARMQAAFAWLSDYPDVESWEVFPWLRGYLEGARQRCADGGYRLELVHFRPTPGVSPEKEVERLQKELRGKGIFGVILPLLLERTLLDQPWRDCTVSVIGNAHASDLLGAGGMRRRFYPQGFESADRDSFYNTRLAFQHLNDLGHERIGFIYSEYMDIESNGATRSAFILEQSALPAAQRVPILFLERFREGIPPELTAWLESHRPSAIICINPVVREWLVELGMRIPEDIGLVNLNLVSDVAGWAGIDENHAKIGAAAVDLLIGQLSRNELGLPRAPRKILVPGTWVNGATLKIPRWDERRRASLVPKEAALQAEDRI